MGNAEGTTTGEPNDYLNEVFAEQELEGGKSLFSRPIRSSSGVRPFGE